MEPWGFEPQIQPCHGRVIPFHYGPGDRSRTQQNLARHRRGVNLPLHPVLSSHETLPLPAGPSPRYNFRVRLPILEPGPRPPIRTRRRQTTFCVSSSRSNTAGSSPRLTCSSSAARSASATTPSTKALPPSSSSGRQQLQRHRHRRPDQVHHRQPRAVRGGCFPEHDRRRAERAKQTAFEQYIAPATASSASTPLPTPNTTGPGTTASSAPTSTSTPPFGRRPSTSSTRSIPRRRACRTPGPHRRVVQLSHQSPPRASTRWRRSTNRPTPAARWRRSPDRLVPRFRRRPQLLTPAWPHRRQLRRAFVPSAPAGRHPRPLPPASRHDQRRLRPGSAWTPAFKTYLETQGLGDDINGYRVDNRPSSDVLPWDERGRDRAAVRQHAAGVAEPRLSPVGRRPLRLRLAQSITQIDPTSFALRLSLVCWLVACGRRER